MNIIFTFNKATNKKRVKRAAFTVANHFYCSFVGKCFFVATLTCKRIIHICQGNNLSADRYFVAFKPVGITSAVPSFMVPAAYLIRIVKNRIFIFAVICRKIFYHRSADSTVSFDNFKLFVSQFPRFVKYFFINGNFAYIMK